jgi:ABC-type multidrug transport system fused ATPase/permease subunit
MAKKKKSAKKAAFGANSARLRERGVDARPVEGAREASTPQSIAPLLSLLEEADDHGAGSLLWRLRASGLGHRALEATVVTLEEGDCYVPREGFLHAVLEGECLALAADGRSRDQAFPTLTFPDATRAQASEGTVSAPPPLWRATRRLVLLEVPWETESPEETPAVRATARGDTIDHGAHGAHGTAPREFPAAEGAPSHGSQGQETDETHESQDASSMRLLRGMLADMVLLVRAAGFSRAVRHWRFALIASALSALFLILVPLSSRYLVDVVILRGELEKAPRVVMAMIAVGGLGLACALLRDRMVAWLLASFQLVTLMAFARRVHTLPLDALWGRGEGRILQLYEESRALFEQMAGRVVTLLLGGIQFTLQLAIVALIDVRFLGIVASLLAVGVLVVSLASGAASRLSARQRLSEERRLQLMHEQFEAADWLHATRGLTHAFSRWESASQDATRASARVSFLHALLQQSGQVAQRGAGGALLFAGLALHQRGELTLGQVVAVAFVSEQAVKPAVQWLRDWRYLVEMPVTLSRLASFLGSATRIEAHDDSVSSRVPEDAPWARPFFDGLAPLQWVHCPSVASRERHAYALAFRYAGASALDVAFVSSDVPFFSGSLLENVAVGDPIPDPDRAAQALRACDLGGLLEGRLRGGLQAPFKGGAAFLSEKERVLLAVARCVYAQRRSIVIDGAFDDFDAASWRRLCARAALALDGVAFCIFTGVDPPREGAPDVGLHLASP